MLDGILSCYLLLGALDPYERFTAMRDLDNTSRTGLHALLTNKWFVLFGWSVVVILMMVLIILRFQRAEKNHKKMTQLFEEKANLFGLTSQERDTLYWIARYARLKEFHKIYFLQAHFETGTQRLLRKNLLANPGERFKLQLIETIESIKLKIGLLKQGSSYQGRYRRGRYLTSRQIPVGAVVAVVLNGFKEGISSQVKVVSNEVTGVKIDCGSALHFKSGDPCTIQYLIGSVLWGFDAIVLSCRDGILEIGHVDHARYINRRRFVRIPVDKPVWVARFPIMQSIAEGQPTRPVFVKAQLTELSGPAFQIQVPMDLVRKERLLVITELEPGKVVQDIAEVQRIERCETGPEAAIELIGLDDNSENELIRITNSYAAELGVLPVGTEIEEEADEKEQDKPQTAEAKQS